MCRKETLEVLNMDLVSALAIFDGPRLGCDDDSQYLLVYSSMRPNERAPSTDTTLLFEAKGFSKKFSSLICLLGGGLLLQPLSCPKMRVFLFGEDQKLGSLERKGRGSFSKGQG